MHAKPTHKELAERIRKLEKGTIEEKRLETTFLALFEDMRDVFYRTDHKGVITWISRSAAEIMGYESTDQIIGRNVTELFYERPEDRQAFLEELSQKGKVTDYEVRLRRRDGSTVIASVNSNLRKNEHGKITGVEGICRDITKRKQVENFIQLQRDLVLGFCSVLSLTEALQLLVDAATKLDGIDCGSLYLRDPVSGSFNLACHKGLSPYFAAQVASYEKGSDRERSLTRCKPLYLEYQEWEVDKSDIHLQEGLRAIAVIPISYRDQVIACLNGASRTLSNLPETTRNELEILASQAGHAIVRIQAEEELRKAHEQLEMKVRERTAALEAANEKLQNEIIERREIEAALRESGARQVLLLRALPMAFYVAQPFGDYGGTWVSEQIDRISGFTSRQFIEDIHLWSSRLHPEDRKRTLAAFDTLPDKGDIEIEYRWQSASGKYLWFLDSAVLIRDDNGAPKQIIGTWLDVTERKQTEEAIFESERKYRTLFEAAGDAIFTVQLTGKRPQMVDCNTRALEMFGLTYKEMITKSPADLSPPVQPDGSSSEHKALEIVTAAMQDIPQIFEWKHCRADGTPFDCEVSLNRIAIADEYFLQAIVRDISERKRAEQALQNAMTEVERLKNRLQEENIYLQDEIKVEHNFEEIISNNQEFRKVLRKVEQVALTSSTVLILGETGTGKELFARAIHNLSDRNDRPLVKVDCAALPANLMESELFGHEKGAYTGAFARKMGRFEVAESGTIFLDEIGELPLELQVKLLRVLQEGEFERLGGLHTIKVDVRVIAATNRNLERAIQAGDFRQDLYYRLNVFPINIPPLRDRKDDIPLLVNHFAKKFGTKLGKEIQSIPLEVIDSLQAYHWPGNVRELENIIERAMILTKGSTLKVDELLNPSRSFISHEDPLTFKENEKAFLIKVLEKTNWVIEGRSGAAQYLDIPPSTLRARIKKHRITRSPKLS